MWAPNVLRSLSIAACLCSIAAAPTSVSVRPLVIWHGLGDSAGSPGILEFQEMVKKVHPGIFVHSVSLAESEDEDRRATFYGNVDEQVAQVTEQLQSIPELQDGMDCMGFSQGGQFLRAYVERVNSPRCWNLITFGSQHMGITDIPDCRPFDVVCQLARRAVKASVYSAWAQQNLVQAQYYRDTSSKTAFENYLAANHFLTDINGEIPDARNLTYAFNLSQLDKLVLIMFSEDKTVVPKESAWFGSEKMGPLDTLTAQEPFSATVGQTRPIVPMRSQPLYVGDWIGLRTLDERGSVLFETCVGEHMQLDDCWEDIVLKYTGASV